ncbi:MAG: NfeD family protein [Gammaproteobacteria bacterium]|nr:NfeD family protein [Gammaproteobacteria bacterium]MYF37948.1 NfeD family protein [Gammaproteobacteria bacterium]
MNNVWALVWLGIGLVFGVAEVLGAGGFLIGIAVAGVGMAIVAFLFPDLDAVFQIIMFAITATVATFIYYKFFRTTDPKKDVEWHDKVGSMVGTEFVMEDALDSPGQISTQIGDTRWSVRSDTAIPKGTRVQIVGGSSTILDIEPKKV